MSRQLVAASERTWEDGSVHNTEVTTQRQFQIPVVLVVGGCEELLSVVTNVAVSIQVLVSECSVADVTNTATQMRPLVLIVNQDVYQRDALGFDELARDIRAKVMTVDDPPHEPSILDEELRLLMDEAESQRPSWNGDALDDD